MLRVAHGATCLVCIAFFASAGKADPCRLGTAADVATVQSLIASGDLLVEYCTYCDEPEPFPLRVRSVEFEHHEPERVREAFGERSFPLEWLERAERDGSGPLVEGLLARIEAAQAEWDGYSPDDPYLKKLKRERLAMFLEVMRENHDMRTWDRLWINGEPADPRLLYYPVETNRYASLGQRLDCSMPDNAPAVVEYEPVARDPAQEKPPTPFVVDITERCYDGSCPFDVKRLEAVDAVVLRDTPGGAPAGALKPGEVVYPVRAVSRVTPVRAEVVRDHRVFLAGDVIYVLDSQGEGYHQVWHYGNTRVEELSGAYLGDGWDYCVEEGGCWARAKRQSTESWWLQVKRDDGTTGWAREPLAHFNFPVN